MAAEARTFLRIRGVIEEAVKAGQASVTELGCISPGSPCHLNYISRMGERDRVRRISTISPLYLPCISRAGERD